MGLVDLMAALGKVIAEGQAQPDVTVQPGYNKYAQQPTDVAVPTPSRSVGGFMADVVRSASDRTTSLAAQRMGIPEATGLDAQQIKQLLDMRQMPQEQELRQAQIDSTKALEDERKAKSRAQAQIDSLKQDPDWKEAFDSVESELLANPMTKYLPPDPETRLRMYQERYNALRGAKRGDKKIKPAPAAPKKEGAAPASPNVAGAEKPQYTATAGGGKLGFNPKTGKWHDIATGKPVQ